MLNTPLRPAIEMGAEDIYVIDLTSPPCNFRNGTIPRLYQTLSAITSAALQRDIDFAHDIDAQYLAAFCQGELVGGKLQLAKLPERLGQSRKIEIHEYGYVRVHKITPLCEMGGVEDFLDFSPASARRLIREGEAEAELILAGVGEEEFVAPDGARLMVTGPRPDQSAPV